ncbi:MAG TPA: substrate-binding domain-containing protein [Burkholderiales bacterium]|nr:substrate-binding domain-containing protein [Burkholderiales bacterium]
MKLKLKALTAACALAAAGQAFAAAPVPGDTPALTFFLSGSSAQFDTLQALADALFQAGNITHITDQATGSAVGSNYRAYFGLSQNAIGTLPAGSKILIIDRGSGGSYQGVGPLARAQSITTMLVNSGCSSITGTTYPTPTYRCTGTTSLVPDLGVSDEEPTLFTGVNLGAGQTALSPSELGSITINPEFQVVIGVPLTNTLYSQLVSARGSANLTRAEIAGLLDGTIQDWSDLGLPAGPVTVETRAAGSGTKAASNAFFLNAPCSSDGTSYAAAQGTKGSTYTVVENGSSGAVQSSLDADEAHVPPYRAIGVLGIEYTPTGHSYKWAQIDGASAGSTSFDKTDSISGKYAYFVTQSIQYRSNATGNQLAMINAFINAATDPHNIIGTVDGILLDPYISGSYIGDVTYGAYVTAGTRFGRTCSPLQLQEGVQSSF